MKARSRKHLSGMTLVELLIVVAIVGVLAAIGVPTFRKMIRKAKQAEAKVQLGAILKLERGFYGEFSTYGNHLMRLGYDEPTSYLTGTQPTRTYEGTYSTGFFPMAICWGNVDVPSIRPVVGTRAGDELVAKFPSYYLMEEKWLAMRRFYGLYDLSPGGINCAEPYCRPANVSADGSTFVASSQGLLVTDKCPDAVSQDIWSIDNAGSLVHLNDGT